MPTRERRPNQFLGNWRMTICLALTVLAAGAPVRGQSDSAPGVLQPAAFSELFADDKPPEGTNTPPPVDLSNLGGMAGGAAGTGSALPTLQGDTTWGGRPAFPQVVSPAITLGYPGLPTLSNGIDHNVFSTNSSIAPGFFNVDSNGLPVSIKSADLVFGLVGFDLSLFGGPAHTFIPLTAMLLSSPLIGYDMINWAENGSVIPQDRVFFDYRHFDSVGSIEIVGLTGADPAHGHPNAYYHQQEYFPLSVDRYVVGFEKTFRDGLWSVEVRFPFQGQPASAQTAFPTLPLEDAFEVGNIGLAIKRYIVKSERWNITGGLGVQLPTAPPTEFTYKTALKGQLFDIGIDVFEVLKLEQTNETVWMNPFLGINYNGPNRVFAQSMMQLCVPLNESHASVNILDSSGSISLYGVPLFQFPQDLVQETTNIAIAFEPLFRATADLGYYLYQNPSGRINYLAAIMEVDDTNTIGTTFSANVVDIGPQLAMNVGKTEFDAGLLVPVSGDQAYNWEVTFRVNRRF